MKRLTLILLFLQHLSFAQVFGSDPAFCFKPVVKIFEGKLNADDEYLIRQPDGGYVFHGDFDLVNGQKIENRPTDSNVKLFLKFNKQGNLVPSYRFISPDKYVFKGQLLKNGKMLWNESNLSVDNVRIIRTNTDGSIDDTFRYYGFEDYIYKKYILGNGKIIVSADNQHHKIINEDGSLSKDAKIVFPGNIFPIYNAFNSSGDYILAGSFDKVCKVYKLNPDFSLQEIFSRAINSSNWLSYSKIYLDSKGRIYLLLFSENGSAANQIIRLTADGREDPTFKTITVPQAPELDPYTARLTFSRTGKIIYSRASVILAYKEDGSQDESFKIASTDKSRIIYDITEDEEILLKDNTGFRKTDFSNNSLPFQLKLEISRPIKITDIISGGNGKYFAINTNYVSRFDAGGKIEAELFSKDTMLQIKQYFDKQLIVKQGDKTWLFSANDLKQSAIPEVWWKGVADNTNKKVYLQEADKIVRYNEAGKEEARFSHQMQSIKQMMILASKKLMLVAKGQGTNMLYLLRLNADGSPDNAFTKVSLGTDGFPSKEYELLELANGNICIKEVIGGVSTSARIRLFSSSGTEITKSVNTVTYYGTFIGPKATASNSLLFSNYAYASTGPYLSRWTPQATIDNTFSVTGTSVITAFEIVDNTNILVANENNVIKLSADKQRFINLQVPQNIDVEAKPLVIKALASDGTPVKLTVSGVGILKDSLLSWSGNGSAVITAQFGDNSCYSVSQNLVIAALNPPVLKAIPTLKTNSAPYKIEFLFPIDTNLVSYEVSGEAYMIRNILYLKGKAGNVCVKAIKINKNNNVVLTDIACFNVEGEDKENTVTDLTPFPNPSSDGFYLFVDKANNVTGQSFQLYDTSGKEVPFELKRESEEVFYLKPVSKQTKTIYLLKLVANGKSVSKRIMIE